MCAAVLPREMSTGLLVVFAPDGRLPIWQAGGESIVPDRFPAVLYSRGRTPAQPPEDASSQYAVPVNLAVTIVVVPVVFEFHSIKPGDRGV